ncbi:MAG TPA: TIGR03086 family metal-binding protein [Actinomycetota bacterium]|nr:TIGR03086 family metal-binding protein [Actinomycetota bacterium]
MADVRDLFVKASNLYEDAVHQIREDQWHLPTPCTEWDVHALLQHLVNEQLWLPPLLEGKTIAEVGDRFDGDNLGDDPVAAWDEAAAAARDAVMAVNDLQSVTHLSFGDFPAQEYLDQMVFDLHIHGWDLRTGIGADTTMDADLTSYLMPWAEIAMKGYEQVGATAAPPPIPEGSSDQTKILALSGRRG